MLDDSIARALGNHVSDQQSLEESYFLQATDDEIHQPACNEIASREDIDVTPEQLDEYLNKQIRLPHGGEHVTPTVIKISCNGNRLPVGTRNPNPIEFDDGSVAVYTANVIAENLAAMDDAEERPHAWFRGKIDHRNVSNDMCMSSMTHDLYRQE
jgi:hypothetical protein